MVDNKVNSGKFKEKVRMDFMLNEIEVKTDPMNIKDEIIHDKPNVIVKSGEVRLKWVAGVVSLISVELTPIQDAADPGAVKKTIAPNTFKGGDCLKEATKNCV